MNHARLTLEQLQARSTLQLKRHYWVIECRLHHYCLRVTMQEDLSRVRTPNAALVLGMLRRVVLSLANAAADKPAKTIPNPNATPGASATPSSPPRGGRARLHAPIFAKRPAVLGLSQ